MSSQQNEQLEKADCNSEQRSLHAESLHSTKQNICAAASQELLVQKHQRAQLLNSRSSRVPTRLLVKRVLRATFAIVLVAFGLAALFAAVLLWLEVAALLPVGVLVFLSNPSQFTSAAHISSSEKPAVDMHSKTYSRTTTRHSESWKTTARSSHALVNVDLRIDLSQSISLPTSSENQKITSVKGIARGSAPHTLFLAYGINGMNNRVGVYDMRDNRTTEILPREKSLYLVVEDVAYSAVLGTLFVARTRLYSRNGVLEVTSNYLGLTAGTSWIERREKLEYEIRSVERIQLRLLQDMYLFAGQWNTDTIHACHVQSNGLLQKQNCTSQTLPDKQKGFDVQLVDNEIRLVAAIENSFVALFRVDGVDLKLKLLSRVTLNDVINILFCEYHLLAGASSIWDDKFDKIASIDINGDILQVNSKHQVNALDGHSLYSWYYERVNRTLYVWDDNTKQLLILKLKYM